MLQNPTNTYRVPCAHYEQPDHVPAKIISSMLKLGCQAAGIEIVGSVGDRIKVNYDGSEFGIWDLQRENFVD